jgi:hypothetical protein
VKRAIALMFLTFPCHAQPICRPYEYAELKDMKPDQLVALYCQYNKAMNSMLDAALSNARAGYSSQRDLATSNRCAQELNRIERILQSKPQC